MKHASNIHQTVFNGFYRTVTHGKSRRIIYKEILLLMVTPSFEHPNKYPPKQATCHFKGPPSSAHPPKQVQETHEPSR